MGSQRACLQTCLQTIQLARSVTDNCSVLHELSGFKVVPSQGVTLHNCMQEEGAQNISTFQVDSKGASGL